MKVRAYARHAVMLGTLCASVYVVVPAEAVAGRIQWQAHKMPGGGVAECIERSTRAMEGVTLVDIRRSSRDVTGQRGEVAATIACVGVSGAMTAIIMVMGDEEDTGRLMGALGRRLEGDVKTGGDERRRGAEVSDLANRQSEPGG